MALNLCATPASLRSNEYRIFCNFLTPPSNSCHFGINIDLKFAPRYSSAKPSFRNSSSPKLSLQELSLSSVSEESKSPRENTTASSKRYIWVNPRSPRASMLRKKSYDSRYASLVKIAESLDNCRAVVEDISIVLDSLGNKVVEQDAMSVLNNMSNAETGLLVLDYFMKKLKKVKEVLLYNVTLKIFRKCKDLDGAEKLFNDMIERGVNPDNVTFSTIISCARLMSLPEKAVEWFEKMPSFGCEPDQVTCSVMIDVYGRLGNVDVALSLYDRARSEKWRLDAATFSTLIRIYGSSGNFDGCLNLYEEMKALRVRRNATLYNSLLDAMGRAKRPWQAKNVYRDMLNCGIEPTWGTYAALLRAYCRARYGEDAMAVYRTMKEKGLELNVLLYNSLLSTCADVGYTDEALAIFSEMKSSGKCLPDAWTYASLITIFSCGGQVEEAESALTEMLAAGYEPNIFVLTSIMQCYGKAGRNDDVVKTFDRVLELGISPDDWLLGCLLSVMTQAPAEDLEKVMVCVEKGNPKLCYVVKLIVQGENFEGEFFKKEACELLESIGADVKRAYCNCLIDLCINQNQMERACVLLGLAVELGIYTDVMSRTPTQWSLHVKSLSLGAALTALHVWINDLTKAVEDDEEMPSLLGINTGHGKHKFSEKGLAGVFESHLKELNAPFHEAPDKAGWFLTTKVAALSWLESRRTQNDVASA
ncbi:pentatricopeptide repeat-containing protein At4g16390, chloroplastic [Andrographis paniculata]|uniref:pentatricopeptide repeat-containing protein At4g16390, chloroplastic n=1 Tax=Andrographis paniculata TaxID=175694 RepID=UPI0021E6D8A6|nr:pentatricopeptide repeat-containing protein At4g16390, chloroplastic [Andrographis paniculata]XP_051134807.1 pentatricopeptide repeat-containing protein At4g16390, chloroplastic [Andrographis paniculata]